MTAPIVTVRGEAQQEVPPDLATLSVTVHSAGDSAERTRSELAEASGRIGSLLERYAAAIEQSSTGGLHIAPIFSRRSGTKITGYRGSFTSQIVVNDSRRCRRLCSRWRRCQTASSTVPGGRCDRTTRPTARFG